MVTNKVPIKEFHCEFHFLFQNIRCVFAREQAVLEPYPSCCMLESINEKIVADTSV